MTDKVRQAHWPDRTAAARRQSGMTTVGFLFLAVFVGLFAFAFIRLTPVYLNYMKVAGVLEGVQAEFDSQNATISAIRTSIERRFDVESVTQISPRDVEIRSEREGFVIATAYDHSAPFIANISFTVHFDKQVVVPR